MAAASTILQLQQLNEEEMQSSKYGNKRRRLMRFERCFLLHSPKIRRQNFFRLDDRCAIVLFLHDIAAAAKEIARIRMALLCKKLQTHISKGGFIEQ